MSSTRGDLRDAVHSSEQRAKRNNEMVADHQNSRAGRERQQERNERAAKETERRRKSPQ